MMHKKVGVYIDDIIVETKNREDHMHNFQKFIVRVYKYGLCFNLSKCVFGVTLTIDRFMVNKRCIKVHPDKIKAIMNMPPLKTEKEIRDFLGQLQYINFLIALLISICEPIYTFLKKNIPTKWNN